MGSKICPAQGQADHKKLLVCCAPTYPPKLALPKKFYGHFEENFFFQKSENKDLFSQNYSFQNLFYALTMFYYTVLTSIYPILNQILHLPTGCQPIPIFLLNSYILGPNPIFLSTSYIPINSPIF